MITLNLLPSFHGGFYRSFDSPKALPITLSRRFDRAVNLLPSFHGGFYRSVDSPKALPITPSRRLDRASALLHPPAPDADYAGSTAIRKSLLLNSDSQIPNSSKITGHEFWYSHRISPRAGSGDPRETSADGGNELLKPRSLRLATIFGLWYFQNVVFNIYNKKVLNLLPFPWFLASFQLFVGSLWMFFLWSFNLQPCPKISKPFLLALLGPALFHTIGHISACVSFSNVAVSFTHVIKSSEPAFSVVFSSFLGESYPPGVWLLILPIVFGCSLAAITEASFNLQGLWGALISNVGFVLRNIYSKKSLGDFKEVNGLNLYGCISVISFIYLFPAAILVEGPRWMDCYRSIDGLSSFNVWVMVSGIFYHLYNQSSYQALDCISPLTFSVGNTMKRVVVIVSSVLVFRNPVRPLNAVGSAIAILGTFLYSQATAAKNAKKVEGDKES